jgi:hypothetical protein
MGSLHDLCDLLRAPKLLYRYDVDECDRVENIDMFSQSLLCTYTLIELTERELQDKTRQAQIKSGQSK